MMPAATRPHSRPQATSPGVDRSARRAQKPETTQRILSTSSHTRSSGQGIAKPLVAFVGLDPQPKQSGDSVYNRPTISHKGDRRMRSLLYLGAKGGVTGKVLKPIYQQFIARGKATNLALLACARRILVWAWAIFRATLPFDPLRLEISA